MSKKYFETLVTGSLCRGGGNGPFNPSQMIGLTLVGYGESLLDVGCGSATTLECIQKRFSFKNIKYKGVDFIKKHIKWCKENFPENKFEVQNALDLDEGDSSWDVVWARHLVDHLPSFEKTLDELLRVARHKAIVILWRGLVDAEEHQIKNIFEYGKTYKNEYTNEYSRKKVLKYLESKYPEWIPHIMENIKPKQDVLIYLKKNE